MSRKGNRGKGKTRFESKTRHVEAGDFNHEGKVNKQDVLRVHVATPAYDGKVDTDFAQQLLMAGQLCSLNVIECSASVMGNGAFIEMARNIFVQQFLNEPELERFTHFFFVDGDVGFEPRGMVGLVRSGLPVSCGVYPRRNPDKELSFPAVFDPLPGSGVDGKLPRLQMNGGWLRMRRVPTGFLCIERSVLAEMSRRALAGEFPYDQRPDPSAVKLKDIEQLVPWLFYTKFDENGKFVGEDYAWCDDYMALYEAGVFDEPIWCWPDFDFVHGGVEGNYLHHIKDQVDAVDGARRKGAGREI